MRSTASFRAAIIAALYFCAVGRADAEAIKIGSLKTLSSGATVFVAQEKGYFKAEGLDAEIVFFESAQPVAVAVAGGDLDFGSTGLTGGFYSLAGQGALKIIAGGTHEEPGYHLQPYLVSLRAYDAGLKSYKDFPGHSFAVSQIGNPPHYGLSLLADRYGFDMKTVRLLPLQSVPNMVSAIVGGQADIAVMPATSAIAIIERQQVKLLGWVGDETPYQVNAAFTATKTANERRDTVERFLRAYKKGARDYHDAVTGADGKRADSPATASILAMIGKYTGLSPDEMKLAIAYFDGEARLNTKDVLRQIAWYKSQGLVKGEADGDAAIDKRYVVALPGK
jgi:NitT/TauT family transport system substrate-binding protein